MNESHSSPEEVPPHPTQNRKEIVWFLALIALTAAAVYGLARVPRYETLAIYVAGLAPALGVPVIIYCRRVRCPDCGRAMARTRTAKIDGQKWGVFRCAHSHGEWRVAESPRPGHWSS